MLVHRQLEPLDAGSLQDLAQHEHVPERAVAGLHQHAGAQHVVAQRPLPRHDLHLGHVLIGVGGPEGVLDVAYGPVGGFAAHAALAGASAAHLVAGEPEAGIFAECLLAGHVAPLGGLVVDVEGVEAGVVIDVEFEDEARGAVHAAAGGHLDGAPLHLARPVDHERLGVDGDVHLCRQAARAGQEGPRDGAVHLPAAAMDEIEDRVVVGAAGQSGAFHRAAHRGLVGDTREHVGGERLVLGLDPGGLARDEHAAQAALALVVGILRRLVVAVLRIEMAMLADREAEIGAAFGLAGEAMLKQPGIVGDALDLFGDGRVRANGALAVASLAPERRLLTLRGRDDCVAKVAVLARPGLAALRTSRHAEIDAAGRAAVIGLDRKQVTEDPGIGGLGDPERTGRQSHGFPPPRGPPLYRRRGLL